MKITRINEFQSSEEFAEELYHFLKSLVPYITSSEGCISCEVLRSAEDPEQFMVIERWESVEFHKKSVESFPKEKMQAAKDFLAAPPKGGYYQS